MRDPKEKRASSNSVAFLDNLADIASLDLVLSYRKATDKGVQASLGKA